MRIAFQDLVLKAGAAAKTSLIPYSPDFCLSNLCVQTRGAAAR
jgi:hypothetical protein